jgi:hypothetical protein
MFWDVMALAVVEVLLPFRRNCLHLQGQRVSQAIKMEVICPSKMLITIYETARLHIPEHNVLCSHFFENLRSHAGFRLPCFIYLKQDVLE